MTWLKRFLNRRIELARDAEKAEALTVAVDEITLNGENLWMRYEKKEPEPDLKTCVLTCVDDDNVRTA